MAQVSSGTVNSNTMWYSTFYVTWNRTSYSSKDNTSTISWEAGLKTSNGVYWSSNAVKINSIKINGATVLSNKTYSNISGNGTHKLASGTTTIKHNDDGNKSFTISISGWLYDTGSPSGSGSFELPTIPRYLTINTFNITNITETTAIVNWSVSDARTSTYYSLDGGTTWIGSATDGESLASDNKSGSFNIKGLTANTSYNIKIKIKRTDNDLWTESSSKSFSTYNYPYCSKMPNFTIGDAVTLEFYNPLNRTFTMTFIGADNSTILAVEMSGTNRPSASGETSIANLYKSIPNAKSGTYKVKVVYGSSTITKTGGTYSIKGNEKPTIGTITYADTNTTVTAITGNPQHIVQNYSNLKVTYAKATAKNSSSISKYTFVLNGVTKESTSAGGTIDFGKINSGSNLTLTVTVTDSRGLTSSTTKTITMLAHSTPTAIVTLGRVNNYEDETHLKVDGSIASVNNKNTMTIKYRYKVSGGSYGSYTTISDNVVHTVSLDKNNAYVINVVVTDAFGSTFNKEYPLQKGKFPFFIDTEINAVGINEFPSNGEALRIKGGDLKLEKDLGGSPKIQVTNGSVGASLHVGAGGVNRGIWDEKDNKWMLYNDGTNVIVNSNLYPISRGYNNEVKDTEIFDAVGENESLYRSGLYSVNDSTAWYNLINVRHRNGYSDGLDYGLQIRKPFGLNSTMQVRSQNSKTWSGWEAIFRSKTLYDNTSGTNGTVTLNETSANFSYLEIFFKNNDNYFNSCKISSPNGKIISLMSNTNNGTNIWFKNAIYSISGETLSKTYGTELKLTSKGFDSLSSSTVNIYIIKVIGYR